MYFVSKLNNNVVKNKSVSHLATAVVITCSCTETHPSAVSLHLNEEFFKTFSISSFVCRKKGALLLVFAPLSDSAASPPTRVGGWVRRRGERRNPWVLSARLLSTASAAWKRDTCRLERYRTFGGSLQSSGWTFGIYLMWRRRVVCVCVCVENTTGLLSRPL